LSWKKERGCQNGLDSPSIFLKSPKQLEKLVEYKLKERENSQFYFWFEKIVGKKILTPTPFFAKEVGRDGVGL
jgi:hypothetical protein